MMMMVMMLIVITPSCCFVPSNPSLSQTLEANPQQPTDPKGCPLLEVVRNSRTHTGVRESKSTMLRVEDGGVLVHGNAPTENQRHSWQRPEGNNIHRTKQVHNGRKKAGPPRGKSIPTQTTPPPLSLCVCGGPRILHFVHQISVRSSREKEDVPHNNSCTIKHSHRKLKKKVCSADLFQKTNVPETTLCPGSEERYCPPPSQVFLPDRSKALQISLSEALFCPSVRPSINFETPRTELSHSPQKGQGKDLIKKCHFSPLFFFFFFFF